MMNKHLLKLSSDARAVGEYQRLKESEGTCNCFEEARINSHLKYIVNPSFASIVELDENGYEKTALSYLDVREIPDIDLDLCSKFKLGERKSSN